MRLVPVAPEEVPNFRAPHRGRVSYPILKMFLESNEPVSMLDRTGMQQSFQSLYSSLRTYIQSHTLPITIFSRDGEIYLARTDLDEEKEVPQLVAVAITDEEVARRFEEEKEQAAK